MYQSPDFIKVETNVKDVFTSYCVELIWGDNRRQVGSCEDKQIEGVITYMSFSGDGEDYVHETCFDGPSASGY